MPFLRFLLALFVLGAASGIDAGPVHAQAGGWPRTITDAAGRTTLAAQPKRIVSTTPSVTGILLAIDAPLIATAATTPGPLTDAKGFFSQWAREADRKGVKVLYPNVNFDIEAVIGAKPDVVIVSSTGRDSVLSHRPELEALGIPSVVVDYSTHSWQEVATELGKALGLEAEANVAIGQFEADLAQAARVIDPRGAKVSIVGYNIAGSYSVARPTSPVSLLLKALGFEIATVPPELKPNTARASDFAFFSRENLSAAITGDTVFLLRATDRDVDAFLAEPVLANHPAVLGKRVHPLGLTSFRIDPYSARQVIATVGATFAKP
ncbi:Fe2+-enterobactin ABC transporter substrate-binding protein [Methylorubrum populi]